MKQIPMIAVVGLVAAGAIQCSEETGFHCGFPNGAGVVQTCNGPYEVCMCSTMSCARPERDESPSACTTGLRYLDTPFARHDWRRKCVDELDLPFVLDQSKGRRECVESTVDVTPDAVEPAEELDAPAADTGGEAAADAYAADVEVKP